MLNDEVKTVLDQNSHCPLIDHLHCRLYLIVHDRSQAHDAQPHVVGRFADLILLHLPMQPSRVRSAELRSLQRGILIRVMLLTVIQY